MGFAVERHAVPEDIARAHGMRSVTNLIVREPFGPGGPTIAMNAHGDVVPPGEGWTHDPYGGEIVDGKIYGRATAVSKGDFSSFTFAVRALESLQAKLKGGVELHFTLRAGAVPGSCFIHVTDAGELWKRLRDLDYRKAHHLPRGHRREGRRFRQLLRAGTRYQPRQAIE